MCISANKNTNSDDYNYSYAGAIGNTFQKPLFYLVSNIAHAATGKPMESRAKIIAKVAIHILIALICVIPSSLVWFAGKGISLFAKTKIDPNGMKLIPAPIVIPEQELDDAFDINILSAKFTALNIKGRALRAGESSEEASMARMCRCISIKDSNVIFPDSLHERELFCMQASKYLQAIVRKIEHREISSDKADDILKELAVASGRCYPTWLEVARRLYGEIHGQSDSPTNKLLRLVQEHKESLILNYSQDAAGYDWHALSFMRNLLGKELGLDLTSGVQDIYAGDNHEVFGKKLSQWLFMCMYQDTNRLITYVQSVICSREYDQSYNLFLIQIVKDKGISDPEDYVAKYCYNEKFELNNVGINIMLKAVGVLK